MRRPLIYQATKKTDMYDYTCILPDITLPDGNGLNSLKELSRNGYNPTKSGSSTSPGFSIVKKIRNVSNCAIQYQFTNRASGFDPGLI